MGVALKTRVWTDRTGRINGICQASNGMDTMLDFGLANTEARGRITLVNANWDTGVRTHTVLAPRCARERPLRAQVSSCSHPWLRRLAGGLQTPISRPPSLPTGASLGSDSRPLTSLSSSTRPRTPHGPAPTRSFGVAAMTATRIARSAATRWRNA